MKKKRMDKKYDPKKLYIKGQRFIKSIKKIKKIVNYSQRSNIEKTKSR